MKLSTFYKWSRFPHIILRKIPLYQQWNPMRKLSKVKKRIFRSINRVYSIDSRYALSKETFLKIIIKKKATQVSRLVLKSHKSSQILKNSNTKWQKSLLKKPIVFRKPTLFRKPFFRFVHFARVRAANKAYRALREAREVIAKKWHRIGKNLQMPLPEATLRTLRTQRARKAYSLNVFRFVFFKKNWILYNPSLVPGMVRPFKFKKKMLLKRKALKGLHNLIGNLNLNFVVFLLKKSINISNTIVPILWNLPRTVDSLKATTFLKLGLVFTVPMALALISQKQVSINGFKKSQIQSLIYPGDYLTFQTQSLPVLDSLFQIDSVSKYLNQSNRRLSSLRGLRRVKSRKDRVKSCQNRKNFFLRKAKLNIKKY